MLRAPPLALVVGFTTLLVGVLVLPSTILAVELATTPPPLAILEDVEEVAELIAGVVEAATFRT